MENVERLIEICKQVGEDVKNDDKKFYRQTFTGRTFAEYMGYHGAAIKALSDVFGSVLAELSKD